MENPEEKFSVIISKPAEIAFYQIVEYFFEHYSFEGAQRIADQFRDSVKFLETLPHRNPQEKALENASYTYRFLLFKRTNRSDIKIIYRIDEDKHRVYVTDFFPTEKDLSKLVKRNK